MEIEDLDFGDEVLVDVSVYHEGEGEIWCVVTHNAYGSATPYPIKVDMPQGGTGQFKEEEIIEVRQ